MSQDNSYKQILRSTSIMGGAQAVNYLVGLLRVKAVAVLLGPVGVGLMGVYASVMAVIGSLTALGIASSGVRSVADAYGRADPKHAAKSGLGSASPVLVYGITRLGSVCLAGGTDQPMGCRL
ncbi:MAG: oligosaccharide flippase family protein [Rhodanobacteraceae bacterium]|nr:oligosaccharide flippase family protein [Rhodanobacteraceae bacterium]